jgi:hypothetical protein
MALCPPNAMKDYSRTLALLSNCCQDSKIATFDRSSYLSECFYGRYAFSEGSTKKRGLQKGREVATVKKKNINHSQKGTSHVCDSIAQAGARCKQ